MDNSTKKPAANTVKTETRLVKYSCIIAGEVVERCGYFAVDFDKDGLPLRADSLLRLTGFPHYTDALAGIEDLEDALLRRETLFHQDSPLDLDGKEWSGTLYFPHLPILG